MTLFNTSLPLTVPQQISRQILFLSGQSFEALVLAYKARYNDFWRNPVATPTEIANAMGVQGLAFFTNAEIMRQAIESTRPDSLIDHSGVLPGWTATPEIVEGAPTGRMIVAQV